MNFHASWFAQPDLTTNNAYCDDHGCMCGSVSELAFEQGLVRAVADALYIDGSWHRYQTSVQAWRTALPNSAQSIQRRMDVEESACHILMSQQILQLFSTKTFRALRQNVRDGEDRGFDDPSLCEQGRIEACEYQDAVASYQRMQSDAKALRESRQSDDQSIDN